jgi:proprotein convertase subtilisin/kexin type 1
MVNDRVEGTALGYAFDKVDIWGPNDNGETVEGPGRLAQEAIERGIKEVRS